MITDAKIKSMVMNAATYQRGCSYFVDQVVKKFTAHDINHYTAQVVGNGTYHVTVRLNNRESIKRCSCECPAYYQYDGACKHIVAVLKEVQKHQAEQEQIVEVPKFNRLFSFFQEIARPVNLALDLPIKIVPTCHLGVYYQKTEAWLEMTIGTTRQYVMRDVVGFINTMLFEQTMVYGKDFTLDSSRAHFTPIAKALWELMRDAYEDERSLHAAAYPSQVAVNRKFILSPSNLYRFFEIMGGEPFDLTLNGKFNQSMRIIEGRPPVKITLRDDFMNAHLSIGKNQLVNLDHHFKYILYNQEVIYKVDETFARYIKPLMQCFKDNKKPEIFIEKDRMADFFGSIMPELEKIAPVKVEHSILQRFDLLPLNSEIYFDHAEDGISGQIKFKYGETVFNPAVDTKNMPEIEGKVLIRDIAAEKQIIDIFTRYRFVIEKGRYVQLDEEKSYDFLIEAVPELVNLAEVYYAENFKNKQIRRMDNVTAGISVNDHNMLEMTLKHADVQLAELLEILASYRLKRRYHRLKDGTFIPLESEELSTIANFMENVALKADDKSDVIRLPLAKAFYLDSLARDAKGIKLERSADFKKIVQDIKEPVDVDIQIPPSLAPILREYQKTGFKWLTTLSRYGLGGILADDMGLGKTLQVITFLLAERQTPIRPSLVIAPTSLLYNWQDEIERFAPELNARVISGVKAERLKELSDLKDIDVVITTYNVLKRDIEAYEEQQFKYCFLDEAQHIKNPNTQNARMVKQIKTEGYFALTGTPIENTLTELWSIFDFLMPGYLLSHSAFKKRFEIPIVKNNDRRAFMELNRHISPFILRRMKCDVLKELPDKTESKMINEMTEAQAKIYAGYFVQAQKEFETELAAHGFAQSRIKILSILTRLRQICCHPSLFLEDYVGGSGKLDMLREVIADAVGGGHRILIFSQFTSMLAIIKGELESMKLSYHYLDGRTPAIERLQLVKAFNSGDKPVFLISLKAGGTGLNLTGADMVIHYDPWWNPAVEDQATDRAYRLGQNNNVQVFKFITKDTIEEKIFILQQKKKALIDNLIQPGENFLSKLSENELRDLFKLT